MRLLLVLIVAAVGISLGDWLLFGVVFHDRYLATPDLWRPIPESRKIAGSMALALVGTAAFFALASLLHLGGVAQVPLVGVLAWLAASLPQTITNTLYVRGAPMIAVSHALGWLARLVIAAGAFALIAG